MWCPSLRAAVCFLVLCLPIQTVTGHGCLCVSQQIEANSDAGAFIVPANNCPVILSEVSGLQSEVWYEIAYDNKTGWIMSEPNMMTATSCNAKSHSDLCHDVDGNCISRGKQVCQQYRAWAFEHCRKFCGLCDLQPTFCADTEQCELYGMGVCSDYKEWSKLKCRKYCGLCDEMCLDAAPDCSTYGSSVCSEYREWSKEHCKNFCGLCDDFQVSVNPASSTISMPSSTMTSSTTVTSTMSSTSSTTQQIVTSRKTTDSVSVKPGLDTCTDSPGIDCAFLDQAAGICSDRDLARDNCPLYCHVCEFELPVVG